MEDLIARPAARNWLLLLPLLLLVGLPAAAQETACDIDAIDVFPANGSRVPTNARFLVEGFGPRAGQLRRLIGKTLVMTSGAHKASVKVQSAFSAGEERIAVALVPTKPLAAGTEWTLELGRVLPQVRFRGGGDASRLSWTTGSGLDRESPVFKQSPAIEEGRVVDGERQVVVRVNARERGPVIAVAKLRLSAGSSPTRRYFTPVRGGRAIIGDGACGGWSLEYGRAYRMKLEALDVVGQTTRETEEIEFNAPRGGQR